MGFHVSLGESNFRKALRAVVGEGWVGVRGLRVRTSLGGSKSLSLVMFTNSSR